MPRHATEGYVRAVAGLPPGATNRLAFEGFVVATFGVGTAQVGRLATETFVLDTKALVSPPAPTSWAWTNEGASLLTEWSSVTDTAGQLTQSTVTGAVRQGTKGIKITGNTGTGTPVPAYVTKTGLNLAGTGWRIDIPGFAVGGSLTLSQTYHDILIARVGDVSGDIMRVFLTGARKLRVERAVPSYNRFASDVGTITNNTWTKLSLELTDGGTAAGAMTVYLDDVPVASATGLDLTSRYQANRIDLGMIGFSATTLAGSIYIDDGAITANGAPAPTTTAVGIPQNVRAAANPDQSVTTTWDPVPDFNVNTDHYEVFEASTTSGPVAPLITTTTRTSGRLAVGSYSYTVVAVVGGVRSAVSAAATVTVGATDPTPTTPVVDDSGLQASFRAAKDTYSTATITQWFNDNVRFRETVSGTHPGGTITTQSQADAMTGKRVVGDCYFNGTFTVAGVEFDGRRVETSAGANVTMYKCLIDGADQTFDADHHTQRGKITMTRCEIRKAQDGFKTFAGSDVTLRYCYIHEPSQLIGGLSGNATHQDGYQMMGGRTDIMYSYIDYQGNHSGGQGIIVKADSGAMTLFRFSDSFLRAGGNNITFEPTSKGAPTTIDLGTGASRNVIAPASNMINVLSLYEPNGALPSGPRSTLLASSFFVADKGGTTLTYRNGISKTTLQNA